MRKALPYFVISLLYGVAKVLALGKITYSTYISDNGFISFIVMMKAWLKCIVLTVFPVNLSHRHVISDGIYGISNRNPDSYLLLSQSVFEYQTIIAIAVIAILFYFCNQKLQKDPIVAFGIGWFFISLLAVSNIIPSEIYFKESYMYLAIPGGTLILAHFFNLLYNKGDNIFETNFKTFILIIIIILICGLGLKTVNRNKDWNSELALAKSALSIYPDDPRMRLQLGKTYLKNDMTELALEELQKARSYKSRDYLNDFYLAEAYFLLNQFEKAAVFYQETLKHDTSIAKIYWNLGVIYNGWGIMDKSNDYFSKAISLQ